MEDSVTDRVLRIANEREEFVVNESGDWVWWPTRIGGFLYGFQLRILADELDRRNAANMEAT